MKKIARLRFIEALIEVKGKAPDQPKCHYPRAIEYGRDNALGGRLVTR